MKIGFDLDNVFIDLPPFIPDYLIERAYKRRSNGILEYRIPMKPEQFLRHMLHHPTFRQPIKENLSFLQKIATKENDLYLISSRYGFLKKRTEELVKKYNLNKYFKTMYFNYEDKQAHLFKNAIVQNLGLDIYVDDDFSLIKYLAKHNKKMRFYWLNPRQTSQLTRNLFAIRKLTDIEKHHTL